MHVAMKDNIEDLTYATNKIVSFMILIWLQIVNSKSTTEEIPAN